MIMVALLGFVLTVCLPGLARLSTGLEQLANVEFRPHVITETTDKWFYLAFQSKYVTWHVPFKRSIKFICSTDVYTADLTQRLPA